MKLKHKIFTFVLSICMIVTCLPMAALADNVPQGRWTEYAADTFSGGNGTKDDPYQIGTAEQLALLVKDVNAGSKTHTGEYFILTDDIDLSGHVWTPLGYETYASGGGSAQSFQGYFDGNNKKITGLYVDEREGDEHGKNRNSGLFGCVGAVGTEPVIQNLIVENATVFTGDGNPNNEDDNYGAGVLIGSITVIGNNVEYASVKNCTVSGTVNSTKNAGGLVGDASYTHFENCSADVKVGGYNTSGGFVGNAFESQLTDCTASGDVTSYGWCTGGFAGLLFYNTTVEHCAAFGNVEAGDWNLGGFAGYTENAVTISNSIAMGDVKSNVTGWDPKTGGFLGTAWDSSVKLEKCHAAGKITTEITDTVGGLIGFDAGSSIIGCSFDNEKNPSFSGLAGVIAQSTAGVKASICADYYGGHDMAAKPEQKPTCTEDGHEAGNECRRCGYKEGFGVIKAPGHTGGTATCKDKAICEVCQEAYGEINANSHADLKYFDAKTPTRDAEGNIEYWYCDGCGKYYGDAAATKEMTKADTIIEKLPDGEGEKVPSTGDSSNIMLWIALFVISGGVMSVTMIINKRKKRSMR